MSSKRGCCVFLKNIFKGKKFANPGQNESQNGGTIKTSTEENTEVKVNTKSKRTEVEERKQEKVISENSICINEHDTSSFFYDKNSALGGITDKNKALENLSEAYGIINKSYEDASKNSNSVTINSKEQFTKVIKGINFKETLTGEESIILTERSGTSNIFVIAPPDE